MRRLARRALAVARRRRSRRGYHEFHVDAAVRLAGSVDGKRVLVVGCNRGIECQLFVDRGAAAVHGVDVISETGTGYLDPRITYGRTSVEGLALDSDSFDVVYCVATLEHVARLDLAFAELARVAARGGTVYAYSAPLWHSSQGHHKDEFFAGFPWIHLRLDEAEIVAYCAEAAIEDPGGVPMSAHVAYMLDQQFFNMQPAGAYVDACAAIDDIDLARNDLWRDDPALLTDAIYAELKPKGYTREELLAASHTFVARKL